MQAVCHRFISGFWKMNAAVPFGVGCGALALSLAQNQGLVSEPEALNKPNQPVRPRRLSRRGPEVTPSHSR
jgi:hypothetical protein